eukprot:comp20871_c0_seq1/m.27672 comp20871_c0_seq1/g.27672  ORF comp20871_c0_seq1/g.27672 comp20871_c0_seq1/m.27672 type:complete len:419 (-) comp20871_c0_seq1:589-1845(-)
MTLKIEIPTVAFGTKTGGSAYEKAQTQTKTNTPAPTSAQSTPANAYASTPPTLQHHITKRRLSFQRLGLNKITLPVASEHEVMTMNTSYESQIDVGNTQLPVAHRRRSSVSTNPPAAVMATESQECIDFSEEPTTFVTIDLGREHDMNTMSTREPTTMQTAGTAAVSARRRKFSLPATSLKQNTNTTLNPPLATPASLPLPRPRRTTAPQLSLSSTQLDSGGSYLGTPPDSPKFSPVGSRLNSWSLENTESEQNYAFGRRLSQSSTVVGGGYAWHVSHSVAGPGRVREPTIEACYKRVTFDKNQTPEEQRKQLEEGLNQVRKLEALALGLSALSVPELKSLVRSLRDAVDVENDNLMVELDRRGRLVEENTKARETLVKKADGVAEGLKGLGMGGAVVAGKGAGMSGGKGLPGVRSGI